MTVRDGIGFQELLDEANAEIVRKTRAWRQRGFFNGLLALSFAIFPRCARQARS